MKTQHECHIDILFHSIATGSLGAQDPCSAFCELLKNNKAVIWMLDLGSGTGLAYVTHSQSACTCVGVGGLVGCAYWQSSQLIPSESVVSLDRLCISQGKGVVLVSHQADDRRLRALHAALIVATRASLHKPFLCFIYSLSDNNKCLLFAILNYIFISMPTSLKQTSNVSRDFKFMWHLFRSWPWGVKHDIYYVSISQDHLLPHHSVNSF